MEDFDNYLFEVEYEDWMEDVSSSTRVWAGSAEEARAKVHVGPFHVTSVQLVD